MPEPGPWKPKTTREQARQVTCPACRATAGNQCYASGYRDGTVELRASCHQERHDEALRRGAGRRSFTVASTTTTRPPKPAGVTRPSRWEGLEKATAEEIRATPCPECGAQPDQSCQRRLANGTLRAKNDHHHQRFDAAMRRLGRLPAWELS